jgi:hypothetical protein
MSTQSSIIQPVTIDDILDLATWNRPRTSEELQSFVLTHHARLPEDTELD